MPKVAFKFNDAVTDKSSEDISTIIKSNVKLWSDNNLEKHEAIFRYSPFVQLVDDADTAILSNGPTYSIKYNLEWLPSYSRGIVISLISSK